MAGLVKHYTQEMKGIPQLTNNWGAMIKLLDAILVNGFNTVSILTLTKVAADSTTATINLGSGHGFLDRQVIRISGSINGWNGDYKVSAIGATYIVIECSAEKPVNMTGLAVCLTAPMDYKILFATTPESTTPKRAYKSTDPESLGLILLVHDFCATGANTTGAKFAKVATVSSMDNIDSITGIQMPYDAANPNANWVWDGVNHGWAKWYYSVSKNPSVSSGSYDASVPDTFNRDFTIVGDGISLALYVVGSKYGANSIYGTFEFFDNTLQSTNSLLLAAGIIDKITQDENYYPFARSGFKLSNTLSYGGEPVQAKIWFNGDGVAAPSSIGKNIFLGSGVSSSARDSATNNLITIPFPVISGGLYLGYLPFLKVQAGNKNEVAFGQTGKYIAVNIQANTDACIKFALTLESR